MSVNEKMTALADKIRELSGTTSKKGIEAMTSDVNAANTEVSEQTDLITQILAKVDSLPEAGSGGSSGGGGSASYDTCTVNISTDGNGLGIAYTTVNDTGELDLGYIYRPEKNFSLTCLCNSAIVVGCVDYIDRYTVNNAIAHGIFMANAMIRVFKITASKNEVATITISIVPSGVGGN